MYVIVDFEWVEENDSRCMPTQLAALRVTDTWDAVDCFFSLFRPHKTNKAPWDHVAFSGSTPEAFQSAPGAFSVLTSFCNWLLPDDILLLWDDIPYHRLSRVIKSVRTVSINGQ